MLIHDLFDIYQKEKLLSDASIRNYKSLLNLYCNDNDIDNLDITHKDIIDWQHRVINRASINTWNSYLRQIKVLFNYAFEHGYIDQNPFIKIKQINNYETKPKLLPGNIDTICKLTKQLEHDWFWQIVIKVLYYTGVRRKRLVDLNWGDVDFQNKIFKSKQSSQNKKMNEVPFDPVFEEMLILYKESKKVNRKISIKDQVFNLAIFNKNIKNDIISTEYLSSYFKRLSKKAGFKISPHRFRHTMATEIAQECNNIKALQSLLGHTRIDTTLRYVNIDLKDLREAQSLLKNAKVDD
jgi:site-specific recombinase XerD